MHLENEDAVVLQDTVDGARRTLDVGNVRIDVVGHHNVHMAVLSDNLLGDRFAEEVVDHRHARILDRGDNVRSEEHTSELQSLMRISYAVFCLKKKKKK